jgi:hypothetical protein
MRITTPAAPIRSPERFRADGNGDPDHRATRGKTAEAVVTFDLLPTGMIFDLPALPCLVSENGIHYYNGWTETYDPDVGGGSVVDHGSDFRFGHYRTLDVDDGREWKDVLVEWNGIPGRK